METKIFYHKNELEKYYNTDTNCYLFEENKELLDIIIYL